MFVEQPRMHVSAGLIFKIFQTYFDTELFIHQTFEASKPV